MADMAVQTAEVCAVTTVEVKKDEAPPAWKRASFINPEAAATPPTGPPPGMSVGDWIDQGVERAIDELMKLHPGSKRNDHFLGL